MDELVNYLTSGKSHAKISAESLEMMGKQAANRFLDEGIALDDSIAKLAGEHADISPEQVKRVVEFANTAVYLARHDQAKTAGANHSYPQFKLADASRIVQDLSDGARPTVVTATDIEYSRLANREKVASAKTEGALAELFKTSTPEDKDFGPETISSQILGAKDTLIGLRDNLSERYNVNESLFKEATADLYRMVKEHLLDNGRWAEVMVLCDSVESDKEKVSEVLEPILASLLSDRNIEKAIRGQTGTLSSELAKLAHRTVNPEHPIANTFSAVIMAANELATLTQALSDVESELSTVQTFIKENYFGSAK